jgi:hypothetical protein
MKRIGVYKWWMWPSKGRNAMLRIGVRVVNSMGFHMGHVSLPKC